MLRVVGEGKVTKRDTKTQETDSATAKLNRQDLAGGAIWKQK